MPATTVTEQTSLAVSSRVTLESADVHVQSNDCLLRTHESEREKQFKETMSLELDF